MNRRQWLEVASTLAAIAGVATTLALIAKAIAALS